MYEYVLNVIFVVGMKMLFNIHKNLRLLYLLQLFLFILS